MRKVYVCLQIIDIDDSNFDFVNIIVFNHLEAFKIISQSLEIQSFQAKWHKHGNPHCKIMKANFPLQILRGTDQKSYPEKVICVQTINIDDSNFQHPAQIFFLLTDFASRFKPADETQPHVLFSTLKQIKHNCQNFYLSFIFLINLQIIQICYFYPSSSRQNNMLILIN